VQPFDSVSDQIKKKLQLQEADSLAFQIANSAYEAIISAGSLTKYAESNPDVNLQETDFFNKDNAPADLKNDQQFLTKAFELKTGELSSLIKGESGYVILFAEATKEPEIPKFEEIKDRLIEDFTKAKSVETARSEAEAFLKNLAEGQDIATLATAKGLEVKESGMLSQNDQEQPSDFPSNLVQEAFLLSPSVPYPSKIGQNGEDFYVYTFLKRDIPAMPDNPDEEKKYRETLLRFKQQQLLTAWLRNLQSKAKITQNKSLQ